MDREGILGGEGTEGGKVTENLSSEAARMGLVFESSQDFITGSA